MPARNLHRSRGTEAVVNLGTTAASDLHRLLPLAGESSEEVVRRGIIPMLHKRLLLLLLSSLAATAVSAAQPSPQVVYLWPSGAATLQGASEKEVTVPPDAPPGQRINSIRNVHNPSIEVHLPPPDKATGAAVIVAPGGGHRQLVWGTEGIDIADWLNSLGVAAFILKYRLAQTQGYQYTVEGEALQDTQRAIRIVRARAKEWGVNPERNGIPFGTWHHRFQEWLADLGMLKKP